jgi:hypothetical protein
MIRPPADCVIVASPLLCPSRCEGGGISPVLGSFVNINLVNINSVNINSVNIN